MLANIQLRLFNAALCKVLLCACLVVLAGCHSPGPYEPHILKRDLENTDVFVILDKDLAKAVTCTGIQEKINTMGQLQLTAKLSSLIGRPMRVEIDCVFKDIKGYATGEVVPFRVLYFSANSQEQALFTSRDDTARFYTIRIRKARE